MSAAAKMTLVDALLLIDRLDKQNRLDWQDEVVVSEFANDLKQGHIWLLHSITGRSEEQCKKFADEGPVNWERCAKQMIFWLQATEDGYVGALKKKEIPQGLYDPQTQIFIRLDDADNYDEHQGFRTNGERDIGCFNGPLGLLEFEKLCYVTAVFATGLDHNHV